MKKLFAAACCAALLAAGIGTIAPAAEQASLSEEEKTVKEKTQIGEKTEGALKAKLTNASGKAIKAFAVKKDTEEEFTENLLAEGDMLADGEVGVVYYAPEGEAADAEAEYVIRLTFEDDTEAELHAFVFSKMKKAKICLEESTAYLVYKDGEEKISTLEAEQAFADGTQADEPDGGELMEYDDYYEDTYDDGASYDDSVYYDNSASYSGGTSGGSSGSGGGGSAAANCLQGGLMN